MLDKIKAEIRKVLDRERDFTTESAKAQALALFWVLELIDKYAEQEPNFEKLKDKLHDKIEIYVCDVEENTLIAQGMLKALGMMDEVLENAEKGGE